MKKVLLTILMVIGFILMAIGIARVYAWSFIAGALLDLAAGFIYILDKRAKRKKGL